MNKKEDIHINKEFSELFEKYSKRIFNMLLSLCGSIAEAQDLTQETFIRAYRKFCSFREESSVYTWIHRIAVNCWKNRLRYNKRRGIDKQIPLDFLKVNDEQKDSISPEQIVEDMELQNFVKRSVHKLKPKYKVPVVLYMQGYSYKEISKITKRQTGTIKSIILRAKLMLKEELAEFLKEK